MVKFVSEVLFLSLLAQASAWTIGILGLGTNEAPQALRTSDITPICKDINNGTHLCCGAAVSGGFQTIKLATSLVGYNLPANTLNGYVCRKTTDSTCGGSTVDLSMCCQVETLLPVWGLWCQSTQLQDSC